MLVFFRTLVYGSIFIGLLFLYLPWRVLAVTGLARQRDLGAPQIFALVMGSVGAVVVLACVGVFISFGKGTPAPFDPPRKLVIRGPYRLVRNPMYIGAALILCSIALYYGSWWVAAYAALLWTCADLLVIFYEEPTLARMFGAEYESYCRNVRRWWPVPGRAH